jgi:predicted RNase H-like nuclease
LLAREAPGVGGDGRVRALLDPAAVAATGPALKHIEDQLDAITCALAALIAWRDGLPAADIFGNVESGYIAVPGLHRDRRFTRPIAGTAGAI